MTRPFLPFFNPSRPVFVKRDGFQAGGRFWKKDDGFPWDFFGVSEETVQTLMFQDFLYHNEDLEEEYVAKMSIGDGLDNLTTDQLRMLVEKINEKVKLKTRTDKEFLQKKCASSKIKSKQIGLIRRWRNLYGEMEND